MATSSEQQLFKRITKLTLLLGILIGIQLVFLGVMFYNFFIAAREDFQIAPLLILLASFLLGAVGALRLKVQRLRSRIPALRDSADRTPHRLNVLLALFMMGLICFVLISSAVNLPLDVMEGILTIGFTSALCLILGVEPYLSYREAQHRGQP